ncbi:FHA domain protein [Mariprofundus micogutta]|uniref:FHA domain protein n=1 Tax=Mariprofundus micogutta TaxID=1921010 RepID=A0A1L8CJZ0_9PROT|nr:FHA domain-containing protein [Mariprofundus micogutta]GAV19205.1 FHA domain protein [Mariprofundus micogutta]
MNEKDSILQILTPKAVLKAMSPEAAASIPQVLLEQGMVRITRFPFKVGRESRVREFEGKMVRLERDKFDGREPSNDLYLIDVAQPLHISREHFQIEREGSEYMLVDRNSACGVSVGSVRVGGRDSGGRIQIEDGDIIAIGAADTPYHFKFIVL